MGRVSWIETMTDSVMLSGSASVTIVDFDDDATICVTATAIGIDCVVDAVMDGVVSVSANDCGLCH